MSDVGLQVRTRRARAGLSQRALSRRTGVPQPNIAAIEAGRVQPTSATLDRLLAGTSVRPSLVLQRHRVEVRDVITRVGGRNPRVFGSVAAGSDTEASDVDLLVDLSGLCSIWAVVELTQELEQILGVHVDLVDDHGEVAALAAARVEAVTL